MKAFVHLGTVLAQFQTQSEIRFLRMILENVDKDKLANAAALLTVGELDDFNKFVSSLANDLFGLHLEECRDLSAEQIIGNVDNGALEAYRVKGISCPQ